MDLRDTLAKAAAARRSEPVPALPDLLLAGIDPDRCPLEGVRMSYMEAGAGKAEAVVLLHGIGSNSTGWRYVLDALRLRFRVVAWNAPGYYLSDNFRQETPAIFDYADALAALLDALGIDSLCLAGSSFGSLVAMSFAARHPSRVKKLALFGASRGQKHLPVEERARRLQAREESVRDGGGIALARNRWKNLLGPNASPLAVRLTQEVLKATNPRGYLQAARASDGADALEFAASITAPTLLAVGTEDRVNPPEITAAIHGAIANSRVELIEGAGHLPKLEAPDRVVSLLEEHFRK